MSVSLETDNESLLKKNGELCGKINALNLKMVDQQELQGQIDTLESERDRLAKAVRNQEVDLNELRREFGVCKTELDREKREHAQSNKKHDLDDAAVEMARTYVEETQQSMKKWKKQVIRNFRDLLKSMGYECSLKRVFEYEDDIENAESPE